MKRRTFLAAAAVASVQAAPQRSATPHPIAGQGYALAQDWDFVHVIRDSEALRRAFHTRLAYGGGTADHLNDEWERYRDHSNHAFGPDGLKLVARLAGPPEPGNIESGMIRSRWAGERGYFEAEMRVPHGKSLWPAFWLAPADGGWPPEIDVAEIVDGPRDNTTCSFHYLHAPAWVELKATMSRLDVHDRWCPGLDYADGFHRFAVLWTEDAVTHYVDDVPVVSRTFAWRRGDGGDAGPAQILLNLAVGGRWAGAPLSTATFPAALAVRTIRVWQR